jgi:hypothetical protein
MRQTDALPCIYVTDYTANPCLESFRPREPWAQGLNGYIVKIFLSEEQQNLTEAAVAGSFYCIRKLRLKHSPVDGYVRGVLGGNERLIVKLNPNKTDNEYLNGLLRQVTSLISFSSSDLSQPQGILGK